MKALSTVEATQWCTQGSITVGPERYLHFGNTRFDFTISLPSTAHQVASLAAWLLTQSEDAPFLGGLLWITQWGIWSENTEEAGIKVIQSLRLAGGETRPLRDTPAMLFGPDELSDLHAFLIQPIVFGWDAFLVPAGQGYFVFNSHDEVISVITNTEDKRAELMTRLEDWKPQSGVSYYFASPKVT